MVSKCLVGIILLSIAVIGCKESDTPARAIGSTSADGSPSSDGSPSLDGSPPSGGASSSEGLNGLLAGEIWVTDKNGTDRFNLQTGNRIQVSNERAYPSTDGSVYIEYLRDVGSELSNNCITTLYNSTQQINVIETRSGEVLSSFVLDRDINGPLRLSPDGKRIGMYVAEVATGNDCEKNNSNFKFSVFSTNGEELYRTPIVGLQTYDWHPNGRLVIVREIDLNSQYAIQMESSPGSYRFESIINFQPGGVFAYNSFRISPTGEDAVMEGVYDMGVPLSGITYRESRIFYFNLFGDIQSASLFEQSEPDHVNSPVFSPDGKHIMVTEGYLGGGLVNYTVLPDIQVLSGPSIQPVVLPASTSAVSYVVPVGVIGQPMPPAQVSDTMRPVLANDSLGVPGIVGFNPLDGYSWTPAID